jgi:protein CpxP
MKRIALLPTIGLAAVLVLPCAAFAQPAPQQAPPQTPSPQAPSPFSVQAERALDQQIAAHLRRLYQDLRITPAQQAQWERFARTIWSNAHAMHYVLAERGLNLGRMNAAQNLGNYATVADVHAYNMDRLAAAFRDLYDAMTPQQQQNATAFFYNRAQQFNNRHHHPMG